MPLIQYNSTPELPSTLLSESSNDDGPANEIDPSRALSARRTPNFAARAASDRIYTLRRQGSLQGRLHSSETLM